MSVIQTYDSNGELVYGGCSTCPAEKVCNAEYRGSRCRSTRSNYGLFTDPLTNADRIRSMNDVELADFLFGIGNNPATGNYYLNGKLLFNCGNGNGWIGWLKQKCNE